MKNGAGIILSAPSSNSGKTIITLGLLRALSREGFKIKSAKSGPDYIDTRFHAAASRSECYNLDTWAMHSNQISNLVNSPSPLMSKGPWDYLMEHPQTEKALQLTSQKY